MNCIKYFLFLIISFAFTFSYSLFAAVKITCTCEGAKTQNGSLGPCGNGAMGANLNDKKILYCKGVDDSSKCCLNCLFSNEFTCGPQSFSAQKERFPGSFPDKTDPNNAISGGQGTGWSCKMETVEESTFPATCAAVLSRGYMSRL